MFGDLLNAFRASRLRNSAGSNDVQRTKQMLHTRVWIDTPDNDGMTALMRAAQAAAYATCELLLASGANPNASDRSGRTPLSLACANKDSRIPQLLLSSGVSLRLEGCKPLANACRTGDLDTAKLLIEKGSSITDLEEPIYRILEKHRPGDLGLKRADEPIVAAARNKDPAFMQLVLGQGFEPDKHPCGGYALAAAVENACWDTASVLLEAGAASNSRGSWGEAIVAALRHEKHDLALSLIKPADTSLNTTAGMTRLFPLSAAAIYGAQDVLRALLSAGADPNARDLEQLTPLMQAVSSTRTRAEALRQLIDAGADPTLRDRWRRSVLRHALGSSRAEVVEMLLNSGASENDVDGTGASAWRVLHEDIFCRDAIEREEKMLLLQVRNDAPAA